MIVLRPTLLYNLRKASLWNRLIFRRPFRRNLYRYPKFIKSGLIILLLFAIAPINSRELQAQQAAGVWMPPFKLFETEGRASEAEVVSDPFGMVHVFWAYGEPGAEDKGEAEAIYYTRRENDAWTEPIDVLISPGGRGARMHSVAVDGDGYLHIVWSGGNALLYSRAFTLEAGTAHGWIPPQALTFGVSVSEPALAIAPDNTLYAVWTQANRGLMFIRSEDGGHNWSTPQIIYQADRDNELARWGRIATDQKGRLHVVLTYTLNDLEARYGRTDAMQLYYLRSDDRGATWSEPFLVTPEPDFGEINVVTFGEDTVHLVWNGRAGRHGRYHRWSGDGGKTWSDTLEVLSPAPQNPLGTGGLTGFPALTTDAIGVLHMVSTTGGGDYYFRWSNGIWSSPSLISPGLDGSGVTKTDNSLEQPSITISQGNQLHAVFHDGFERIWYTDSRIDAPAQSPQVLTTPELTSTVTHADNAMIVTTGIPEPTPLPILFDRLVPPTSRSPLTSIWAGALSAILLAGLVFMAHSIRRKQ